MLTTILFTLLGAVVALLFSALVEFLRRPLLAIETGEPADAVPWSIVHIRVKNRAMKVRRWPARFVGRLLTGFPASGCSVSLRISSESEEFKPLEFDGKWSSRREPVTDHYIVWPMPLGVHRISTYDPQKLPGIHHLTLQPGSEDQVAVAIRPRGKKPAFAYWATELYPTFPEAATCELPPGSYEVEAQACAGEVCSGKRVFKLDVAEHDSICLSAT